MAQKAVAYLDAWAVLHNLYFVLQRAKMRNISYSAQGGLQIITLYFLFNIHFVALPSLLSLSRRATGKLPAYKGFRNTSVIHKS